MLRSLQQRCWDVLTWLQEKAVAFLEAVCSAVSTVHRVLSDFCSSESSLSNILVSKRSIYYVKEKEA